MSANNTQQEKEKYCIHCYKEYFESQNNNHACRYHPGPYTSSSRADTGEEGKWDCCGENGTI